MCGIFGVVPSGKLHLSDLSKLRKLMSLSERRGSDSSGILKVSFGEFSVIKGFGGITAWSKSYIDSATEETKAIFGHTRLATHGDQTDSENNQPILAHNWSVFHNGIVTNHKEFIAPSLVDTFAIAEVLNGLEGTSSLLNQIERLKGELSFVAIHTNGQILVYSNVGGIFYATSSNGALFFASESEFLREIGLSNPSQVEKNNPLLLQLATTDEYIIRTTMLVKPNNVNIERRALNFSLSPIHLRILDRVSVISNVRRCTDCLISVNFPRITFNDEGRCAFCLNYNVQIPRGEPNLIKELSKGSNQKRVLVNLSGGRDSCFALHKTIELGFNPIAFTYDWGFVSTAARENMARMCGALNVQHIVVSPDIQKNRRIVSAALSAWLKKPNPGTIPILMSGDKPLLTWSMKISAENNHIPIVHGDHSLENTHFKSALAGAKLNPETDSLKVSYKLDLISVLRMSWNYLKLILCAKEMKFALFIQTLKSAYIYYGPTHRLLSIFEYLAWKEEEIEEALLGYGWSTNSDSTKNAWRMGDSTAPLYNLLYLVTIGFTENDSLISNKIRAGMLTREEGLKQLQLMNVPDFEGVESYLNLIEFDSSRFWNELDKLQSNRKG